MRIFIRHEIDLAFEPAVKLLNAALRLTPRSHDGQHMIRWRVETDADGRMRATEDAYGNIVQALSVAGPTARLRVVAEGAAETFDTAGVARATVERFPPILFLRDTEATTPDAQDRTLVAAIAEGDPIERLHSLMLRLAREAEQEKPRADKTGADVMGAATALTHRFIACARLMGAPARFVAGYHLPADEAVGARHCWAEAHVEGVGWIGFDVANEICPHESHVRGVIGLDALEAGGVRAAPLPAATATTVTVRRAD